MGRQRRIQLITILSILLLILGIFIRVEFPPIGFKPEVLFFLPLGDFTLPVSNALLSTAIVSVLLILIAFLASRRMTLIPGSIQNALEAIIETIYNQAADAGGEELAKKSFSFVATIFLFVLISNLLGLFPGFGTIGLEEMHEVSGHQETVLVPIFRAPSSDLNMTAALALISVGLSQVFAVRALGVWGYLSKFINVRRFFSLLRPPPGETRVSLFLNGLLDLYLGLIELFSEFAKIFAFTFRLFGNIFAGEMVLLVMAFFFPFLLPIIFFAFEALIGFIQAFIFAILTISFMSLATGAHGETETH